MAVTISGITHSVLCVLFYLSVNNAATITSFTSENLLCNKDIWGLLGGDWTFNYTQDDCWLTLSEDASSQATTIGNAYIM